MPIILEFSREISIFIAEKISLCEGEKEKDLARKTVNSNYKTAVFVAFWSIISYNTCCMKENDLGESNLLSLLLCKSEKKEDVHVKTFRL